jgi:hypothetical protein
VGGGATVAGTPLPPCSDRATNASHVIRSGLLINTWLSRLPSVDEVRPRNCPDCGAWHRSGRSMRGHGLRRRLVLGPAWPGGPPEQRVVLARRYRCTACGCVIVVVPAEVAAHCRYSLSAILWALALWGLERRGAAEVRRRTSVNRIAGFGEPRLWRSLRRWAQSCQRLWPTCVGKVRSTLRETAAAVVTALIARQPGAPPAPVAADAWRAAQFA